MSPAPAKSALSSEVKVGLLFFAGLALMLWFTFFVTEFGTPKGDLSVRFRKVTQLKEGDPVTFNGVRVGTVAAVLPDVSEGTAVVRVEVTRVMVVLVAIQVLMMAEWILADICSLKILEVGLHLLVLQVIMLLVMGMVLPIAAWVIAVMGAMVVLLVQAMETQMPLVLVMEVVHQVLHEVHGALRLPLGMVL